MTPQEYVEKVIVTESNTFLKKDLLSQIAYKLFNYFNSNTLATRISNARNIRLLHGSIGLCTEIAELFENLEKEGFDFVNLKEEVADAYWYIGIMIHELKLNPQMLIQAPRVLSKDLSDKQQLNAHIDSAVKHVGLLQDLLKKSIFYGKPMAEDKLEKELVNILVELSSMCSLGKFSIEDSMISNIEKLRARYGDKFSEKRAIERNLKVERQILEK